MQKSFRYYELNKLPVVILFSGLMLGMPSVYDEAFAGPASPIDIVFIIDNSASMAGEIADVKANIGTMNTDLVNANVDPRYGLVRIGGPVPGGHFLSDITDFATFNAALAPLIANAGNPEAGSVGVNVAFANTNFRGGNVPICIVLITDEDDDSSNADFVAAQLNLANSGAVLTLVGALGVGNTAATYSVLASGSGGDEFTIASFQADAAAVLAAITAKVITQAEEADPPVVAGELLAIDTTALLIAGIQANLAWMIVPALLATGTGIVLLRNRLNII